MRRCSMSTGVQQCGSGLAIKGGVNGEILIISFPPFPSLFPVSVVQTAPPFENCVSVSFSEPREERHIPPLSFTLKKVSVSHRRSRCTSSTFYSRFALFFLTELSRYYARRSGGKKFSPLFTVTGEGLTVL